MLTKIHNFTRGDHGDSAIIALLSHGGQNGVITGMQNAIKNAKFK